jgi:hypothetical protein
MAKKRKRIEVALIATENFKTATQVNMHSLTFGRTGYEACWAGCRTVDVNQDGLDDLLCEFDLYWDLRGKMLPIFHMGDTVGILRGETLKGDRIVALGDVRVVGLEEEEAEEVRKNKKSSADVFSGSPTASTAPVSMLVTPAEKPTAAPGVTTEKKPAKAGPPAETMFLLPAPESEKKTPSDTADKSRVLSS